MKQFAQRLALMTCSLLLGLLLVELAFRLARLTPERYARPTWAAWYSGAFRPSDIWGNLRDANGRVQVPYLVKRPSRFAEKGVQMGEYVPNAVYKCIYASNPRGYFDHDGGVIMTLNPHGMRTGYKPVSLNKVPGTTRVLLLGDSFTFGIGVRDQDTFAALLEKQLNAAGDQHFEVLNAGVQGYNTRDEVLYLEHHWMQLEPDIVLIVFYLNDAYSDSAILNNGETLGIYLDRMGKAAKFSYVWDMVQHRRHARKVTQETETYYNQQFFSDAARMLEAPGTRDVDWTLSKAALLHAAELCRARHIPLGLAIFPELFRLDEGYPFADIHTLVSQTCQAGDVPCLDLFDTFEGHDPRKLWVHPSDHHPNEVAHRMTAKAMRQFVRSHLLR